jgi:putative lipoprotein
MASIRVTVFYRERIAMPPDAAVVVTIADISRADAPAEILATRRVDQPGNVPVEVDVEYDPSQLAERGIYAARAMIEVRGELWWTTTTVHHVLTDDTPDPVELMVTRIER